MDITVTKQDNCTAALRAVIAADVVAEKRSATAALYASQVKVPGFRPGKTPVSVVAKRFAKEIDGELKERFFQEVCDAAVEQDKDLKVLDFGTPTVCDVQEDGTFVVETAITFIPAFELPEYKGLTVTAKSATVADADVDSAMEDLRKRYADYEVVDRALTKDDVAVVDFTSSCEGKPVAEVIGKDAGFIGGRENQWIRISDDHFLPGFASQLEGMKPGDKKTVSVVIPEKFPIAELVGKTVDIDVTVKETRELVLPELNDDFASRLMAEGGTVEQLKKFMTDMLTENKKEEVENDKIDQVAQQLAAKVDFALPEALVDRAAQDLMRSRLQALFQEIQAKGGDFDKEIENLKEECKTQASTNLKVHFILQDIARKEGLQVTDQELSMEIYRIAQSQKKQPKAVVKELRKNGQMNGIAQGILSNKTVSFILEQSNVTEA